MLVCVVWLPRADVVCGCGIWDGAGYGEKVGATIMLLGMDIVAAAAGVGVEGGWGNTGNVVGK